MLDFENTKFLQHLLLRDGTIGNFDSVHHLNVFPWILGYWANDEWMSCDYEGRKYPTKEDPKDVIEILPLDKSRISSNTKLESHYAERLQKEV